MEIAVASRIDPCDGNCIMIARLIAVLALGVGITPAVGQPPEISPAAMPALKCVYGLLQSYAAVQSVDAYAVDGLRSAIEYSFRDRDGRIVISDIMLSGVSIDGALTYSGVPHLRDSQKTIGMEMDFLRSVSADLRSKCHVTPALDDLLPEPKSRPQWRRVDLSN